MINPKRLHASDVSILILHHCPVGKCVSRITRSRLGHLTVRREVGSLRYVGRSGKCRIGWRSIVHVKLEDFPGEDCLGFSDEIVWRSDGRRRTSIVAGKQGETGAGDAGGSVDYYAPQHCATHEIIDIECIRAHLLIGATTSHAVKHVRGHVETVRPDAHLGIIRKPWMRCVVRPKGKEPPAASHGIARL